MFLYDGFLSPGDRKCGPHEPKEIRKVLRPLNYIMFFL